MKISNFDITSQCIILAILNFISIISVDASLRVVASNDVVENVGGTVGWDDRAILINGKRELLMVGHIHYPRSTPDMWPSLFERTKEAGINAIDTYVFWNDHEKERGIFDFSGNKDLRKFIQLAGEYGLYVVLRIGPYVCAEWSYGGFPSWLRDIPGIDFRSDNEAFKQEMSRFVLHMVEYTRDLFHENGGPVIILQIENEYGLVEKQYGEVGHRYIEWAADFANSINTTLPWIMCVQDNVPQILNTCNGFYCDGWVAHDRPYKNQPGMFTENWTGWFMAWGDVKPTRPVEDLAFSVARWVARGGTYNAYYMWHGGTNFGRTAGYNLITSYDYDAPLDEYGFKYEPKYSHLKNMHKIFEDFADTILDNHGEYTGLGEKFELHEFGDFEKDSRSVIFVSNVAENGDFARFEYRGFQSKIPPWSVSIIQGPASNAKVLFNTAILGSIPKKSKLEYTNVFSGRRFPPAESLYEPIGSLTNQTSRFNTVPLEQLSVTRDKSDFLWYELHNLTLPESSEWTEIHFDNVQDHVMVYWNKELKGISRGGDNVSIKFRKPDQTLGDLKILTSTLGLTNFGPHMQDWSRGIPGKVTINGEDITELGWLHSVGLRGEKLRLFDPTSTAPFRKAMNPHAAEGLKWYKLYFPGIPEQLKEDDISFAFDLGSMGKGNAWVNGHHIGRYWNISGHMPDAPTNPYPKPESSLNFETECTYTGVFNPDKCRLSTVGKPTQRFYHVPKAWLKFGSLTENILVLFEEEGGNLSQVQPVSVRRKTYLENGSKKAEVQHEFQI